MNREENKTRGHLESNYSALGISPPAIGSGRAGLDSSFELETQSISVHPERFILSSQNVPRLPHAGTSFIGDPCSMPMDSGLKIAGMTEKTKPTANSLVTFVDEFVNHSR